MPKSLRWTIIILVQLLVISLLLEFSLRTLADRLPPRLAVGAARVLNDARFQVDTVRYVMSDGDHGMALLPDLDKVTQQVSPEVSFTFSTRSLWGSRFGFRNPYVDYAVDVAVVGDSFSFCFTEYADCWVTRFQQETGLGVVNLGQPGTASVSHLNMIRTFAAPLRPRLVLWQFFGNDFNEDYGFAVARGEIDAPEDAMELDIPPPPDELGLVRWLRGHSVAFAVLDITLGNFWPYASDFQRLYDEPYQVTYGEHTLQFGQPYELQVMDMSDPRNSTGLTYSRSSLAEADALVDGWGGQLAVILMPTREQVYAHLTQPLMPAEDFAAYGAAYDAMRDLCSELDLLCFDPLPSLQAYAQAGEHLYYSDDLHLNPRGNDVLQEMVWRWLGGYGLLYE